MNDGRARLKEIGLVPLALDLVEAAAYVGMSRGAFIAAVNDGVYPQPLPGRGKKRWNRVALEAAHGLKATGSDAIMGAINEARSRLHGKGEGVSLFPARKGKSASARRAG